jgi:fermentation-respiration switch protein FrsA (DUF1100 family)/ketosteroid isomerase-like protein
MAFTTKKTTSAVLCSLALAACGGTSNFTQNQAEALVNLNESEQVKQTIVDLINAVDAKQWQQAQSEMTANIFTDYSSLFGQPGAEVTSGELVGGWQNLLQNASTHHILSNFDISVEGNTATAYSHVYASHVADGIDYWDVYGRYVHKLVKQQGDWKINSMTLLTHGQKGNPNFVQEALAQNEKLAASVKKQKVNFASDGENVVGNIYYPANYDANKEYPAIVVSGSWTTVKEQMGGLYAEKLAEQGYITLAFDFRNFGESEGSPRFHENPDKKVVDIKNAVTFLQSQSNIDGDKIGALGICAGSAYTLMAAAEDKRIKSVVTAASWLHDAEAVKLFYGGEEGVNAKRAQAQAAKKKYDATGEVEYIPSISTTDKTAAMYGPYDYYLNPDRGAVPEWSADKFAVMTWENWLTLDPMSSAKNLTSPTLMIHSDGAVLPQYTKKYFANIATDNKSLHWIETDMPSPYHQFNFYDQESEVNESITKAADWFATNL